MNNMFNNGSRKQTISLYVCKKQRTWNSVWLETNLFIPYVYKIQCFLTYRINFNLTRSSHPIFGSARSSHLAKSSRSQLRVGKFIHVFQPGIRPPQEVLQGSAQFRLTQRFFNTICFQKVKNSFKYLSKTCLSQFKSRQ